MKRGIPMTTNIDLALQIKNIIDAYKYTEEERESVVDSSTYTHVSVTVLKEIDWDLFQRLLNNKDQR